jgi:hypothetical protein
MKEMASRRAVQNKANFRAVKRVRPSLEEVQSHPEVGMVLKSLVPAGCMGYNQAGHRNIRAY